MQINRHNFLRWFTNSVTEETIKIPRLSLRQPKCYLPVLAIGEDFAFYINSDVPFGDSDTLRLDLINSAGTVITDVAPLVKDTFDGGYKIMCEGTMDDVPAGQYHFRIFNGATKCVSNYFQVMTSAKAEQITVSLKYRNSRDRSGFRFIDNPDFYNMIRVHLMLMDWNDEGNFTQYREVSTGTLRNEKEEVDRMVKVGTYFFDDGAHDAMFGMCPMDDIQINGVLYRAKGIYKANAAPGNSLSKGEVDLYDVEYSKFNKYGNLE